MKRPSSFTAGLGFAFNVSVITAIILNYPNLIAHDHSSIWLLIIVYLFIGNILLLYWCFSTLLAIAGHLEKEEEEKLKLREEMEKSIRKELEEEFRKKTE